MKRIFMIVILFIFGLLLGFLISNKNRFLSSNSNKIHVIYDTSKKIDVNSSKETIVDTKYKDNNNLSIILSNVKEETINIKFGIKNNSNNNALVNIESKYDKNICDIKINPNKIELGPNKTASIELEVKIKDINKLDKEKFKIDVTIIASSI